jgi:rod shape-determining protein MreC
LLAVSYQIKVEARMSLLEKTAMTVFAPLQELNSRLLGSVEGSVADRASRQALEHENARLETALRSHRRVLTQLAETELENARMRRLLDMPEEDGWSRVYAAVIGANHRRNDYMITINKGSDDGLRRDQGVICPDGVVGVIWEVTGGYAKVMTANNPSAVIAAMLQDGRESESFAVGTGNGNFMGRLESFPNFREIRTNDLVLTSGLDGEPSQYMFQDVDIHFTTDFTRLEEVVVLIPRCREDLDALE